MKFWYFIFFPRKWDFHFDANSVDWPCADFYLPVSNNIFARICLFQSIYSVTYFNHLSHVNQQRQIDTFSHNVNISLPTLHFTKASFTLESMETPSKCRIFVHWARIFCKLLWLYANWSVQIMKTGWVKDELHMITFVGLVYVISHNWFVGII